MRKAFFIILSISALLLTGCTDFNQVEDLAFAEVLGVDLNDANRIEVSIQVPQIAGKRGEDGSGGGSSQLIYSAAGDTLDEALHLLQWAVPRRLDLSQIELIVISENLASNERFLKVCDTIMATPRLYTAARLAVCSGSARDFVAAEKPVIGTRTSTELAAAFSDYARNGFIPNETFSDVFYRTRSVYSDVLAIHADTAPQPEEQTDPPTQPASAMTPSGSSGDHVEMQHSNRFLGAAMFHNGLMVGKLSADEYLYCKILRGEQQAFPFSVNGQTVGLTTLGSPDIRIDLTSNPIQIDVTLRFSIVSSSNKTAIAPLKYELENELMNVVTICQKMKTEPFGFSDSAASLFPAADDWIQFGWTDRFSSSQINITALIHSSHT